MNYSKALLLLAVILSFLVLLIVPIWFLLGVGETGEQNHHAGEIITEAWFRSKLTAQQEEFGLPDGSVRFPPSSTIFIIAQQFAFLPTTIRVQAGGHYELQFYSPDVLHGASLIQSGTSSLNTVIMPGMISSVSIQVTHIGSILMLCNEYCGVAHHLMIGKILVEGSESLPALPPDQGTQEEMPGMDDHH